MVQYRCPVGVAARTTEGAKSYRRRQLNDFLRCDPITVGQAKTRNPSVACDFWGLT